MILSVLSDKTPAIDCGVLVHYSVNGWRPRNVFVIFDILPVFAISSIYWEPGRTILSKVLLCNVDLNIIGGSWLKKRQPIENIDGTKMTQNLFYIL